MKEELTTEELCKEIKKIDFSKEILRCYKYQYPEQNLKYAKIIRNSHNYQFHEWKVMLKTYNGMLDTLEFLVKLVIKLGKET